LWHGLVLGLEQGKRRPLPFATFDKSTPASKRYTIAAWIQKRTRRISARDCYAGLPSIPVLTEIGKPPFSARLFLGTARANFLRPAGDRQLCYNKGTVDFLGSRGYAMSVLRPQPIAEQEKEARAWRERFVQNAVANVRLEGLEPSPKALEIWQSCIEGEVSVEQAGELIRALPTGV
jgi:hypothetical protein